MPAQSNTPELITSAGDRSRYTAFFEPWWAWTLVLVFILVALTRIFSTYSIFSQTYDEPAHIARGMEWLDKGEYTYFLEHPPLAPVMVAAGPYLYGARATSHPSRFQEGNAILHTDGAYFRNLTLARLGTLPFFILATLTLWLWAKRDFNVAAGLLAAGIFTTLPSTLAHSGLATTDMAFTAMFLLSLFAFRLWLERPALPRSVFLGTALGLVLITKFSALAYFPISAACITLVYASQHGRSRSLLSIPWIRWAGSAAVVALLCGFVIWSGYRFSFGTAESLPGVLADLPLPAPEFILGIRTVINHNNEGHLSFLLGEAGRDGWWNYFPVVIAVKTPLAILALLIIGSTTIVGRVRSGRGADSRLIPALASLAILGFAMTSNINIGQRHILPIYPFFAMIAGFGAYTLWCKVRPQPIARTVLVLLLIAYGVSTGLAHPNHLAYFNEMAKSHPENVLVDSNLDWGQDIYRLAVRLEERNIDELWSCLHSSHRRPDLVKLGLPPVDKLPPYKERSGWIAVSMTCLKLGTLEPPYDQYDWLEAHEPVERIGRSIFLYYIPPEGD